MDGRRADKSETGRANSSIVLATNRFRRPSAFLHVAPEPPLKAELIGRVDIDPQLVERQQRCVVEGEKPFHKNEGRWLEGLRPAGNPDVSGKIVKWALDRIPLRKGGNVFNEE